VQVAHRRHAVGMSDNVTVITASRLVLCIKVDVVMSCEIEGCKPKANGHILILVCAEKKKKRKSEG